MRERTLAELLDEWESFATGLDRGYDFGLDDYLNDLDVRQLIAGHTERRGQLDSREQSRLRVADARVRAATDSVDECLWGPTNAAEQGLRREEHWWYFALPKRRCAEFDEDLAQITRSAPPSGE